MSEPAAARARAIPRPIPLVEPVISDTLPARNRWLLIFPGLMAMFMAAISWLGDASGCCFEAMCRAGATQGQCRLANGSIQSCYGNASGQIFPRHGQRAEFHQSGGDVQRDAAVADPCDQAARGRARRGLVPARTSPCSVDR